MIKRIATLIGAVAVALTVVAAQSQAAPAAEEVTQAMVAGLTAANPGAHAVSANTVRLANGVTATATPASLCPYYDLCIYDGQYRSGYQWNFFNCGFVNIGAHQPDSWSDRIQSFSNNQTPGTVSIFMNWNGSSWDELYRSTAYERQDTVGSVHWTDGLWVC